MAQWTKPRKYEDEMRVSMTKATPAPRLRMARPIAPVLAILVIAASWGCKDRVSGSGAPPTATAAAEHKLRQMSDTLSKARQLTFKAVRQLDAALVDGSAATESTSIEVAVSR